MTEILTGSSNTGGGSVCLDWVIEAFGRKGAALSDGADMFTRIETELSGKIVTFRYLCQRLRTYSPLGSRVALASVGKLPGARRPFFMPIGEFVLFAVRQ